MADWALALCPVNRETAVAAVLTKWQFPNVLFKVRTRVLYRGAVVDRLRPAFPRYLFCKPDGLYHTLRTRIAGLDFVRDGQIVATVPEPAINSLLDVADENQILPTPQRSTQTGFQNGDRVQIRGASMLSGYSATYEHAIDATRAVVLISWLGRMCPASIDERDLVPEIAANQIVHAPRRKIRRRRRKGRHQATR